MSTPDLPDRSSKDSLETPMPEAEPWHLKPSPLLSPAELSVLNEKSDSQGWKQLLGHLAIMGLSGGLYGWGLAEGNLWLVVPTIVVYGFSLAAMFAPLHECVHRTAFAHQRLNDGVAWFAGVLSFYNSTFYRRYHKWHHRYTQIPDKDPELGDPKPATLGQYLLEISGLPWWWGKLQGHFRLAIGHLDGYPYIPEAARSEVVRSMRLQLLVYAGLIGLSIGVGQPWFVLYWLLPLAVGQPILRAILITEHTGCTPDDNPLTNTRTTRTIAPLRFLMWNMPFHAEHHLYASIPFHALPAAHAKLADSFAHVDSGYLRVNRTLIANLNANVKQGMA